MKKLLSVLMVLVLSFSTLAMTACGPSSSGPSINEGQTQLYVGLFKDGITDAWLQAAIDDFEDKYKDVSFETGKKGVQVVHDYSTGPFKPGTFESNVKSLVNSLYFLDQEDYTSYVAKGLLRDMTTILEKDVYNENGEMVNISLSPDAKSLVIDTNSAKTSMMDIMYEDCKTYFNRDGKFYSAPYLYIINGAIYDADYFNDSALYFFANGEMGATQADIDRGESEDGSFEIGYGPDGVKGTTDDGMPETWDDFIRLCQNMDATPFVWSGKETYQRSNFFQSVWANYQGYEDFMLLSKLQGTLSDGTTEVNANNALEILGSMEGRKAGIKALYDIKDMGIKNSRGDDDWTTYDEYLSQSKFVYSVDETKRVAMLLDGGYWEVNMKGVFEEMSNRDAKKGYGMRDFRLLPIPNFTDSNQGFSVQKDRTDKNEILFSSTPGIVCMPSEYKNQNDVQDRLAELFLYFTHSREQMIQFTKYTGGCIKPYHFDTSNIKEGDVTKFGANILSYLSDGAKIATTFPLTDLAKKNHSLLYNELNGNFVFRVVDGQMSYTDPISYFKYYNAVQGVSASEAINRCFNDMKASILSTGKLQTV